MRESRRFGKGAETGNVLIAYAHPDEMSKPPHRSDSKPHSTLVERQSRFARANKPKALSTSTKCEAANVEDVARSACSFVKQNSTLPQPSWVPFEPG